MKRLLSLYILFLCVVLQIAAQKITGHVTDLTTGEGAPFVNVFYEGTKVGVQTDIDGNFSINARMNQKLTVSCVGYETYTTKITSTEKLEIKLKPMDFSFAEAKVVGKKEKYSRKNNPAVELMKKVIENKKYQDLKQHDYYTVQQYNKLNFALADVTPKVFEEGKFKRMPFLKDHVEVSPETGKLILPLILEETVTDQIYRKKDDTKKEIVIGKRNTGVNQLMNTGEIASQLLNDFFTEVNLYEDDVRLLQYQFISPLSKKDAIAFYRYFIADTTMVDNTKCIEVQFTPNNSQDFGFSGEIFVTADSTYRVKKVAMGVPVHTGVNFVDLMKIDQTYEALPTGEQVLIKDNMLLVMKFVKDNFKVQAKRTTEYSQFDFSPIEDKAFRFKGDVKTNSDAAMQSDNFWAEHRSEELSHSEGKVNVFLERIQNMKGFKPVIWTAKAFIENYVETTLDPKKGSKIDFGPINTTFGYNDVDGFRPRISAFTTGNMNPHLFLKGYVAYGTLDDRWKGKAEVTYSFNKKKYVPKEFPVRNLTAQYYYDVNSPSDIFMPTDKDNIFVALKWSKVDHMNYDRHYELHYDNEWENGLRMKWKVVRDELEPCSSLFYQPVSQGIRSTYNAETGLYELSNGVKSLDGSNVWTSDHYMTRPYTQREIQDIRINADLVNYNPDFNPNVRTLNTTTFTYWVQWQPGAEYLNTKQRRILVNQDAPLFSVSHTIGMKGLGSDYTTNNTEFHVYKRWWVKSWGKMDFRFKAGVQWNQVPFPMLCMPWANTSYIREGETFSLIKNMEFLNDRYASFMYQWDLNGKLMNRIPGIRRLKWREYIGFNALWGTLSDKNNPYLEQNQNSDRLFYFPSRVLADGRYEQQSQVMDMKKPYVEAVVGIHNIFKILWVQYVHRITYINEPNSMYGDTQKWGIRILFKVTF